MKKTIPLFLVIAVLAATIATYSRYESFSPCIWIEQDQARATGLPTLVMRGRVHAEFLLRGISEPNAVDCLLSWWNFRLEGATRGA